ncbi:MAG: trypsin-like peptidase domain-containing protein [Mariniblastus sp.]|nr:trypsin-like peptidase domain-containing protein [Mariniblastus sp.]
MKRRLTCASHWISLILLALFVQPGAANDSTAPQARLYFFTSPACPPCRQVEPAIRQLAAEGYPVTVINTSSQPDWARHFKVNRTPTTILVADQQVVGRQTGLITLDALRGWFAACRPATAPTPQTATRQTNSDTTGLPAHLNQGGIESGQPTMHQGTTVPANQAEQRAMAATVRLKVADPQGTSYATGTIIHRHQDECLILTCGHVFRDSQGQGAISIDYDFVSGQVRTTSGRLLSYDAQDRDIALVSMTASGFSGPPVFVAQPGYAIQNSDQAFSIGCDHGEAPTIRRTRIKNLAKYNGVDKYDIFGRPVDGRSGGGLFTPGGQLVGVCNAAAVDFDEGIYVALNTIYWQLQQANLTNLFTGPAAIATNYETDQQAAPLTASPIRSKPQPVTSAAIHGSAIHGSAIPSARDLRQPATWTNTNQPTTTGSATPGTAGPLPNEAIVILRSSNPNEPHRTLTISNPPADLVNRIYQASATTWEGNSNRLARLQNEMPLPRQPAGSADGVRSQSPR